ncbi:PREDICTED: uncharacterized protein LOC101806988 [Ficedula albicollis]|uniref:uncharacterized protein LOC101806988 n=1 Tax=Ficedula albicollis TaxID=59894 RepID=UPI000359B08C|nr:PREDICTED: uncharacterized protein LOC101806988 [Ficedula albicollis]
MIILLSTQNRNRHAAQSTLPYFRLPAAATCHSNRSTPYAKNQSSQVDPARKGNPGQLVPKPGNKAPRPTGDGNHAGGRRDDRSSRTDSGGEDAPGTTEMDTLGKVISELHVQWGIQCKVHDFTTAIRRLLKLNAIDHPVDILHSECWGRCTAALAEDVITSGSSKSLKSWGKVKSALQKALEEQEVWKAAQRCLRVTPKLGVGAATQTSVSDEDITPNTLPSTNTLSSNNTFPSTNTSPLSCSSSPTPASDSNINLSFNIKPEPLPHRESSSCPIDGASDVGKNQTEMPLLPTAPQYGAEGKEEGRDFYSIPANNMAPREKKKGGTSTPFLPRTCAVLAGGGRKARFLAGRAHPKPIRERALKHFLIWVKHPQRRGWA